MRRFRTRFLFFLTMAIVWLMVLAPVVFARDDGGEGFYGESSDKAITNVMFMTIAFFPLCCLVFSVILWRLEKRKYARQDAAKRRAKNVDWRGGW
jgi:preprotein translocase subunit SecG